MPVDVVVLTTIFKLGTRGSMDLMSWVQMLTSPTLTAWNQMMCRFVRACLIFELYFPKRCPNPGRQLPRRHIFRK